MYRLWKIIIAIILIVGATCIYNKANENILERPVVSITKGKNIVACEFTLPQERDYEESVNEYGTAQTEIVAVVHGTVYLGQGKIAIDANKELNYTVMWNMKYLGKSKLQGACTTNVKIIDYAASSKNSIVAMALKISGKDKNRPCILGTSARKIITSKDKFFSDQNAILRLNNYAENTKITVRDLFRLQGDKNIHVRCQILKPGEVNIEAIFSLPEYNIETNGEVGTDLLSILAAGTAIAEQKPKTVEGSAGDTLECNGIQIKVDLKKVTDTLGEDIFQRTSKDREIFAVFEVVIKNKKPNTVDISPLLFEAIDTASKHHVPDTLAPEEGLLHSAQLFPGEEVSGLLVFTIPDTGDDINVQYKSGNCRAVWKIPAARIQEKRVYPPEIQITYLREVSDPERDIEIGYRVYNVIHDKRFDIHIYEKLYNPYGIQMWPDYDVGRKTGQTDSDYLTYAINTGFPPYPGTYILEITIVDNISGLSGTKQYKIQIQQKT